MPPGSTAAAPDPPVLYAWLTSAPRGTAGTATTSAFAAVLSSPVAETKAPDADIADQLARHADAQIFTSLRRSGALCATRLLGAYNPATIAPFRRCSTKPTPAA